MLARREAVIDAHALTGRRPPIDEHAALRQEAILLRVFGVETRFDGVAVEAHLVLLERQLFAGGDAQLPGNEIKTGHRLGDRMLDLKPGVHLEEIEFSRLVEQKLDGAGADVADGARRRDRGLAHLRAQFASTQQARAPPR